MVIIDVETSAIHAGSRIKGGHEVAKWIPNLSKGPRARVKCKDAENIGQLGWLAHPADRTQGMWSNFGTNKLSSGLDTSDDLIILNVVLPFVSLLLDTWLRPSESLPRSDAAAT